jgi:DNA-binding XRE family transcriptional regulator
MAGQTGVRERRLACGLTQAELAVRAGVSRQLVAAVEGERHAPAVDAALGIARALGTTVEELFMAQRVVVTPALGIPLREGALLRVGRIDDHLVAAELPDHGTVGPVWGKPDGVVEQGQVRLLPGGIPAGFVVAGCDPALGVAEAMLACTGPLSLLTISAPTGRALKALEEGGLHAAAVHGRVNDLPKASVKVARWHLAKWHVGVAFTRHRKSPTLDAVLRTKAPIIQRDPSAASQQTLLRAAKAVGLDVLPAGPHASGHLEAARLAYLTGGTAVTIEAGARAFDLDFIPLEEHVVELWVNERWRDHPGLAALGEILTTAAFVQRVALFGGYDLTQCGDRVSAAA